MKRPSTPQILARQRKLQLYKAQTGKSNREIAKEFGVTTKQAQRFLEASPKSLRKTYSRSKGTQELYQDVGPVRGKGSTKVRETRIVRGYTLEQRAKPIFRSLGRTEQERITRAEIASASYRSHLSEEEQQRQDWARWTDDHGLPVSWIEIKRMYADGEIDDDLYAEALEALRNAYGKKK